MATPRSTALRAALPDLAVALTAAIALACADRPQAGPADAESATAPLEVPGEGYATSDACRSCHPGQYASWHASYHRTMTRPATPENVLGDFGDVRVQAVGHEFHLSRRGDAFFATIPDPEWNGEGTPRYEERRIALVTGRHHLQIYWYETGATRVLGSLPVAWDPVDERWFPADANFIRPPNDPSAVFALQAGNWNRGCIACHVTDERPRWLGPEVARSEASEFGIACEACHGPSRRHAEQMRAPLGRYAQHLSDAEPDDVVNPETLGTVRGSQVCGRCHSVWVHRSNEDYAAYLEDGVPFRPGDRLHEQGVAVVGRNPADPGSFWPDGEVRPSGREYNGLVASPCFAGGEFGCTSCHTMHPEGDAASLAAWRDDQLRPGMRGDAACLQCHDGFATPAAVSAHTHHEAGSPGSACQNCHMPFTNLGLRKAIRSHTISSPSVATDRATGRPNACSGCHIDRPLGFAARALAEWYGHPLPELTPIERAVPAAVVDLLAGDAAERALAASALGWAPAVAVAEAREWAPPLLAVLLEDPYEAVRYHAKRSLRRLPGYEDVDYDWVGSAETRRRQARAVRRRWAADRRERGRGAGLGWLLTPAADGGADLPVEVLEQLARARDDTPIEIRE